MIQRILDYSESLQLVHYASLIMSPKDGDDVTKTAHTPLTRRSNCIFMYFFCHENDLCTLFVAKNDLRTFFVAKAIYALHPEIFCTLNFAIRKVNFSWENGFFGQNLSFWAKKTHSLFYSNHVLATTKKSCGNKKVPFS